MAEAAKLPPDTPLVLGAKSLAQVSSEVLSLVEGRPTAAWWIGFSASLALLLLGVAAIAYEIAVGIGTWGLNTTVGWGFAITNFVFWIGIGHAGTLISAILYLLRQKWRNSVNRSAEAMTIFAVLCAGLFPVIHLGRPWLAYWIAPYPNTRGPLWVNFRSPLVWDFFAILTYFTISFLFWYFGLIPDFATLATRAKSRARRAIARFLSFGWNGSTRTWVRYETVYLLLAGLATPLVVSVHTIVSWDFATSLIPGWHSTIFPPYFVTGAIFSGFAMVLTLMLIARKTMALEDYITVRHVEAMCKVLIATGGIVGLSYLIEVFCGLYSGNPYEGFLVVNRAFGPYAWAFWLLVFCNVVTPQLLWSRKVRRNLTAVWVISVLINLGMWLERFVIVVTSLHWDFLPSSWAMYKPTAIELAILAGSFGLFFTCFLLFVRFVPVIAISEVKSLVGSAHHSQGGEP